MYGQFHPRIGIKNVYLDNAGMELPRWGKYASVAQLVEHLTCNEDVARSTRAASSAFDL